ncbi:MAG: hypothetical protein IPP47_26325 [Bryobacterales bacterium]|nr:hypothetical protein [Bryobacterales bacterium]
MAPLLAAHAGATLFMVGLIWFVQVVHYPLFGIVGADGFAGYERAHTGLTTIVVGPPMLVELGSAVLILLWRPVSWPLWAAWLGLALLAVIWASTLFLQVPRHGDLSAGFAPDAHRALVATNWIRTVAWTLRGAMVLYFSFLAGQAHPPA